MRYPLRNQAERLADAIEEKQKASRISIEERHYLRHAQTLVRMAMVQLERWCGAPSETIGEAPRKRAGIH